MEKVLLTVTEVGQMLGWSSKLVNELVRRGDLQAIEFGRRTRVPVVAVEELLAKPVPVGRKVEENDRRRGPTSLEAS